MTRLYHGAVSSHRRNWIRPALLGSASILVAALPVHGAAAQDVSASAFDEADEFDATIVVTGVRGSLDRAMDVKRDASGVVDAISAEDIGKFPDTNIAESLQRITGVSIDRVAGEGSQVTVRGFGGGFNLVTLNGRQLPSANVGSVSGNASSGGVQGTSRSFDFSNVASEGVSGIQVYKTGRAAIPSGGIGATINLQTIRPLDAGIQASIGAKAVYDTSSDEVAPEVSGLASWVNDAGTFGVSLFGAYQQRKSSSRLVSVAGYTFFDYSDELSFLQNADIDNAPADGALIALPNNIGVDYAQIDRERINGMATVQFAPTDRTRITLDALYTSNDQSSDHIVPGIWYSRQFNYVEFDGSEVVAVPSRLIETIAPPGGRGKDYFFSSWQNAVKDEMRSFGLNVQQEVGNTLVFALDAATSRATSGGGNPGGYNSGRINLSTAGAGWQAMILNDGVPNATVGVIENTGPAGGNGNGLVDAGDLGTQVFTTNTSSQDTDLDQINLSGKWDGDDGISVDFGVGWLKTRMRQKSTATQDVLGGWGVGVRDIPDLGLVQEVDVPSKFQKLQLGGYPDAASVAPPGYVLTTLGQPSFQVDTFRFAEALDGYGGFFDFNDLTRSSFNDNTIDEEVFSAFASATFEGEIAGLETQTVVGVRYERTDVTSTTLQNVPTRFTWQSDNDFFPTFSTDLVELSDDHSYTNVLPNIDFSVDITDRLKGRLSISQTIARPAYNYLFITTSAAAPPTLTALAGVPTASSGNVRLDPLESTNFDASLEYYYADASYASIGYFRKAVNNFVGTATVDQPLFGLRDPASGAPGTLSGDAAAALRERGSVVNEQNLFTMSAILANPAAFPTGADAFIDPSQPGGAELALNTLGRFDIDPTAADPLFVFRTSQPVNNETANISGFEFAWQHFFGDTGFGFQANATLVQGDIEYDIYADPTMAQFALEGLSDSANLVAIYDKNNLSARVAYNWRDTFLQSTAVQLGLPSFIDGYSQIDFNISYTMFDNLTLSLDGINITNQGQRAYSRTRNMPWFIAEGDARYVLSARYTF